MSVSFDCFCILPLTVPFHIVLLNLTLSFIQSPKCVFINHSQCNATAMISCVYFRHLFTALPSVITSYINVIYCVINSAAGQIREFDEFSIHNFFHTYSTLDNVFLCDFVRKVESCYTFISITTVMETKV